MSEKRNEPKVFNVHATFRMDYSIPIKALSDEQACQFAEKHFGKNTAIEGPNDEHLVEGELDYIDSADVDEGYDPEDVNTGVLDATGFEVKVED